MKRLKRLLAVIMAIICAGSIANFDVKAEGLKINEKHKKAKIIREIKELKTKTSSTYQLDNGARLLKVNLGSEDSEMEKNGGNLKKITKDGRKKLKELDVRNVSNYLMSNSSETKKNYFPKELSETQGVVMENEQKIIEFTPTDSEGKKTKVDENCITYKMKDGKIDYKYLSYENGVKEEIILNEKVENNMDTYHVSNAISDIWAIIARTNKYIDETAPWTLSKSENEQEKEKLKSVMFHLAENLRKIAILITPIMPETSNKMLAQLGLTEQDKEWETLNNNNQIKPETKVISKGEPLFVRLEKEEEIEYIKNAMKK